MVTGRVCSEASHSRQMPLSLFGERGARCPGKQGTKHPHTKPCDSIEGAFYPFVSFISMRFQWIFSEDLKEPLNDLRAATAKVKAIFE